MFCQNCGKQIDDDSAFCEFCGAKVGDEQDQNNIKHQTPFVEDGSITRGQPQAAPRSVPDSAYDTGSEKKDRSSGGIKAAVAAVIVIGAVIIVLRMAGSVREGGKAVNEMSGVESIGDISEDSGIASVALDNKDSKEDAAVSSEETTEPDDSTEGGEEVESESLTDSGDSSVDAGSTAEFYSTDESGSAMEFEWFSDINNSPEDAVITDPNLLVGGWKCCFTEMEGKNFSGVERYLHANIETDGKEVLKVTLVWDMIFDPSSGSSYQEEGSNTFSGPWDGDNGTANLSGSGSIAFEHFFEKDGKQYGTGVFSWPSGEEDVILLVRP